ncbi:MAG: F0F1 ATP synthase subunit delta [Chloroflexota bacterium]|nr:F0F1 ATP synthase subunit delta [Chloroflexota bacterium]
MLDIDLVTILAEIINFLVLAVALYFLLFKPSIKRINQHSAEKEALLAEARSKEQQADQILAEIEKRLSSIDAEIESRLEEAYQQAQDESSSLLEITQKEAEKILSEAENEATKRQQQEFEELQENLVGTILNISGQILRKTTPEVTHDNLVEVLNSEIWDLGKSDMRQVRNIRDSLANQTPTVYVTTAKTLSPEQQRLLIRTFSALADKNISMEIEVDAELIAGVQARIGDLIVENTLAMELNELKSEVVNALEESVDVEE